MPVKASILFIIHLPPPLHGASVMGNFIKTSTLINDNVNGTFVNLATNTKLEQSGKAGFRKLLNFLQVLISIIAALTKKKFDLCYITLTSSGPGFYKDILIVLLIKIARIRIIYHFHNKGVTDASLTWSNNILYRFIFHNTKSILLSPYLYADISKYVNESNVFYCPNGIPVIQTCPDSIEKNYDPKKPCAFLYLSNMLQEKGAYILLDSLKELKKRHLNFRCDFVGGWSDITEAEFNQQITDAGLADHVFAHGAKYGQDKIAFLKQADVFIFPTFYHYEAFPLVNLEAMQYALPIISTPEGGIPDIVIDGETGFLIPQKDTKALANKLEILYNDSELRRQMGAKGKERFEQHFTLSKFESRMITIFNEASGK